MSRVRWGELAENGPSRTAGTGWLCLHTEWQTSLGISQGVAGSQGTDQRREALLRPRLGTRMPSLLSHSKVTCYEPQHVTRPEQ